MSHWLLVGILFFMTVLLGCLTSAVTKLAPGDSFEPLLANLTVGVLFGAISIFAWGKRKGER